MRQFVIYLLGLVIITTRCTQSGNKTQDPSYKKLTFTIPTIIDTFPIDRVARETIWQESGSYNPLYIGKRKDSIWISNGNIRWVDRQNEYFVYGSERDHFPYPDSSGIELIIDTSKFVFEYAMLFEAPGNNIAQDKFYKAYPVYVISTTKDTLSIGYGDHLPLILEAVDENGKWRAIQNEYTYICGTGLNTIILPPYNFVLTSVPIFKGQFKTKLRLRYKNILSDDFTGTINHSQFESEYDQ